jgi:tetratricopeptide (TPR) repeat protein
MQNDELNPAPEAIEEPMAAEESAPEPEPEAEANESAALVTDGQRLLGQGRSAEALAIAEGVLEDDPLNSEAWALKGDALERQGDVSGALGAYERIEELGLGSPLDRIRVAQLRKAAEFELLSEEEPPARRSLLLAVAASVLLLSVTGLAFWMAAGRGGETEESTPVVAANTPAYEAFQPIAPAPNTPAGASPTAPATAPGAAPQASAPTTDASAVRRPIEAGRLNGSSRPLENPGTGYQPLTPMVGGNAQITPVTPGAATAPAPGQSQPEPEFEGGSAPAASAPAPIIEIRPSEGSGSIAAPAGGGDSLSADALVRKARDAYLVGNYAAAADAYEQALRMGASPGSVNQRLGQCYENLGQRQSAIRAYERAVAAYERSRNRGQGDASTLNAAIEVCRSALRRLRG